jgi:uncharacterized protein (DUF302 family)
VNDTVDLLVVAVQSRGINIFTRIDHAAAATDAGLQLGEEQVVVFGDPRAGTLLMQEDPEIGYELPLRVLVWDAGEGTIVGYRRPTELAGEYRVSANTAVLERMDALLQQLVAEAVSA